ncbi:hypothetical protein DY000_02023828 [Brassica cretica]|uniref:Uncharacterized protein n=1 Tax=Brassica cretica TaxID=69181 RepID=A0ABQ7ECJ6_BRACR|nr:hypothetical protein DY000_02023828 [Brassica cretica]
MSIEKQHLKRISKIGAQHTKPKINKILPDPSKNEEHVSSDDSRGMDNLIEHPRLRQLPSHGGTTSDASGNHQGNNSLDYNSYDVFDNLTLIRAINQDMHVKKFHGIVCDRPG